MTNERPDFVDALRRADAAIAVMAPPSSLGVELRERLAQHGERRGTIWPLFAAPVALAAALFVAIAPETGPRSRDLVRFVPAQCAPAEPASTLELAEGCTVQLDDPKLEIVALDSVSLVRATHGFVVRSGSVVFDGRLATAPFVVFVSTRRLEAVAARFEIDRDVVRVEEGHVLVEDGHGARVDLARGDALSWAAPETWSVERIDAEVRRATQLRIAGEYARAADLLEQLLASPIGEDRAAVLSYERAVLLETRLDSSTLACTQYRTHRMRFGRDRYAAAVDAAFERCRDGASDTP